MKYILLSNFVKCILIVLNYALCIMSQIKLNVPPPQEDTYINKQDL